MATVADDDVRLRLTTLTGFLRDHLPEHAEFEERDLYPTVERLVSVLGGATKTISCPHRAIRAKVEASERFSESMRQSRRVNPRKCRDGALTTRTRGAAREPFR